MTGLEFFALCVWLGKNCDIKFPDPKPTRKPEVKLRYMSQAEYDRKLKSQDSGQST